MAAHERRPGLVALVGPTAVGKTAAAIYLGQRLGGEIVSADSRQIYQGLSIGTAKPTPAEQAAVPHHLLDIRRPDEAFSLAEYLSLANETIAAIQSAGRLPLLVGGTAQYAYGVIDGWQPPPVAPEPELRQRLALAGPEALHARLAVVDPSAAAAIGPTNLRRLVRALEVWEVTGRPISDWQQKRPPAYPIARLGLALDRSALHTRIAARVDAMLAAGLVEEVAGLLAAGYPPDRPAFASMGYREIIDHLAGRLRLAEARQQIIINTHRFVRHQETWWRRDPRIVWVDASDPAVAQRRLAELVSEFLAEIAPR